MLVPFEANHFDDIERCMLDPVYFIEKLIIVAPDLRDGHFSEWGHKAPRPFKLFAHQVEWIKMALAGNAVALKCRQIGISETSVALSLWLLLFGKDEDGLLVSTKEEQGRELMRRMRSMYSSLPRHLRQDDELEWKSMEVINNGLNNRILSDATSQNTGRGGRKTFALLDEVDFYQKPVTLDVVLDSIRDAVPNRCWIVSTPHEVDGAFHRMVNAAQEHSEKGIPFKYQFYKKIVNDIEFYEKWYSNPETKSDFLKYMEEGRTPQQVRQNLYCEFEGQVDRPIYESYVDENMGLNGFQYDNDVTFCGIDIGWSDFCFVIFSTFRDGKIILFDEIKVRFTKMDHLAELIKSKGYNIAWVSIDTNAKKVDTVSGSSPYNILKQRLGVPFYSPKLTVAEMFAKTNTLIVNDIVRVNRQCSSMRAALMNAEWSANSHGPSPILRNQHKHCVDALHYLMLVLDGIINRRRRIIVRERF